MSQPPRILLWRLCLAVVAIQVIVGAIALWIVRESAGGMWVVGIVIVLAIALTVMLFWIVAHAFARHEHRQLEALRSDFAANVSHELRTPITNIKGYVETMLEVGLDDPKQAREFLDIIKRNSDRLAAIVEDILSLAWLEQPGTRKALVREECEMKPILEAVAGQFENAASAKNIAIAIHVDRGLTANVNAQLIEQAVANYVSNAIKYSPVETTVTIKASLASQESLGGKREWGEWIEIAVIDEGQGIAPEHLPRIFERFYRVDKARSRALGGTGLGLAIVKHIALIHGGWVAVDSDLGKGSVFRIILPAT